MYRRSRKCIVLRADQQRISQSIAIAIVQGGHLSIVIAIAIVLGGPQQQSIAIAIVPKKGQQQQFFNSNSTLRLTYKGFPKIVQTSKTLIFGQIFSLSTLIKTLICPETLMSQYLPTQSTLTPIAAYQCNVWSSFVSMEDTTEMLVNHKIYYSGDFC